MLVSDTDEFEKTKLYTLIDSETDEEFLFENFMEAKEFIEAWHRSRILAIYAYYKQRGFPDSLYDDMDFAS